MQETRVERAVSPTRRVRTPAYAARLELQGKPKAVVVWVLVAVQIVLFGWMMLTSSRDADAFLAFGAEYGPATLSQPWRLITGGFVHASVAHIAFNTLALIELGVILERTAGRRRFTLVYGLSLLGASAASLAATPTSLSLGASGAILGLAGYQFVDPPRLSSAVSLSAYRKYTLVWFGLLIVAGLFLPFDNAAHIGGFATGAALALVGRSSGRGASRLLGRGLGHGTLVAAIALLIWIGRARLCADPPALARVHYLRALPLLERHADGKALAELDAAIALSPERAFFLRRAQARLRLGDGDGAWQDTRQASSEYVPPARQTWVPFSDQVISELYRFEQE